MDLSAQQDFKVRVVAIDEQPIFLDGLRGRLKEVAGNVEIVAEAHDGDTAYQLAASLLPHVILMEMNLKSSNLSSLEVTKKIKEDFPDTKILILSSDDSIDSIMGALRAGASGYLLKPVGIQELKDAIFTVISHGSVLSPTVAQKLLMVLSHPVAKQYVPTERELEILKNVELGMSNKAIATKMFLSSRTIEVHLTHIFQKLAVSSRTEAVIQAIKIGLIPAPKLEQSL